MSDKIPAHDVTDPAVSHHSPDSQSMYESRRHIYVREIKGVFQRVRRVANWALMLGFLLLPWIPWGDRPAVWFDLPGREFHIFAATFYPQEFVLLSWLLIICAFGLFFITVFAGRVWCGYTCPQSVWTFLFIWVEHRIEGPRNRRIKLDKRSWDADKAWRKSAKHAIWLIISAATGITFVGYFTPIGGLVMDLATLSASGWSYFWVGFFIVFTYLNAGWLREQVCLYMCPYARFQSVMFDRDTLIVSYDYHRGEPRGPRKRNADPAEQGLGHCIDCDLCVQVCPTGIDIRDGLQYQCITCAACIDACDSVMDKMGYPRGLVRYTTEHALDGNKTHLLRPRLIGYLVALVVMIGLFVWTIADRTPLDVDVERDRARLYQILTDGRIANSYAMTVRNLDNRPHRYVIEVAGIEGLESDTTAIEVPANQSRQLVMTLSVNPDQMEQRSADISVRVLAEDDPSVAIERESRFIGVTP
ncbi:cytochrome c oxidase accessory protein CcoG [Halomonas sp. DP1Y21-3]|uniref:cytochrome c oxidase accessory protein CcoG n=1 Tax=Halomonas sp. DP1Y21-3 TaxID=2859080 RepID=UPI0021BD02C6|nr:cytochrome c oxidase accessory protein CcoG [Halomonas sp. DP1Y21-3]